jgi:hypothetical protein
LAVKQKQAGSCQQNKLGLLPRKTFDEPAKGIAFKGSVIQGLIFHTLKGGKLSSFFGAVSPFFKKKARPKEQAPLCGIFFHAAGKGL